MASPIKAVPPSLGPPAVLLPPVLLRSKRLMPDPGLEGAKHRTRESRGHVRYSSRRSTSVRSKRLMPEHPGLEGAKHRTRESRGHV
eukprot:1146902-Pelagomonas_calceolata.AAC.2